MKNATALSAENFILQNDPVKLRRLLDKSNVVDAKNEHGQPLLIRACMLGKVECLDVLIEAGAKIEAACFERRTALAHAASEGHAECVAALLAHGARIEGDVRSPMQPMHFAAQAKRYEAVAVLAENGVDIEGRDLYKRTALMVAVEMGCKDAVETLLALGADRQVVDSMGRNPAQTARYRKQYECEALILGFDARQERSAIEDSVPEAGLAKRASLRV